MEKSDNTHEVSDKATETREQFEYRQRMNKQYSLLLSLTATMITFIYLVMTIMTNDFSPIDTLFYSFKDSSVFIIVLSIIIACILPLMISFLYRDMRKIKSQRKSSIEIKNENQNNEL